MADFASARDKDLARVINILAGLAPREVEALNRFYMQEQEIAQIAADLGMDISHLRELKSRVKTSLFGDGKAKLMGCKFSEIVSLFFEIIFPALALTF